MADAPTLYDWTATRSGPAMTIAHSTGKITGIVGIEASAKGAIATHKDGRAFKLANRESPYALGRNG